MEPLLNPVKIQYELQTTVIQAHSIQIHAMFLASFQLDQILHLTIQQRHNHSSSFSSFAASIVSLIPRLTGLSSTALGLNLSGPSSNFSVCSEFTNFMFS